MTKLLITGKSGRMGQTLIEATELNPQTELGSTHDAGENLTRAFDSVDAAIDFTIHSFTSSVLDAALASNAPLVIGTTGHTDEERTARLESYLANVRAPKKLAMSKAMTIK